MANLTNGNDAWQGLFDIDDVVHGLNGNDTLRGGGGNDRLFGEENNDLIDGENGNDTIEGGSGDDTLSGGSGADRLLGGEGKDVLFSFGDVIRVPVLVESLGDLGRIDVGSTMDGGGGDDIIATSHDFSGTMTIIGGEGTDALRFVGDTNIPTEAFRVQLVNRVDLQSQSGTTAFNSALVVQGIENVFGDDFNDLFRGDSFGNRLFGGGGNDRLEGRGGADTLEGGIGFERDVAEYSSSLDVDVDLTRATQLRNHAQGDVLINIEDVDGSYFGDTLRGDGNANYLFGNLGDDLLEGRGGADTLDGGGNSDTASYESSAIAVQVTLDDLSTGAASLAAGGDAAGDVLISIENLVGSGFNDRLTGNTGDNVLDGKGGADRLIGGLGNDTYFVDIADRQVRGTTPGTFVTILGDQVIENPNSGFDTVKATVSYTLANNIEKLELLEGSAINGTGNSLANTIVGNSSANILDGGTGIDTMFGGDGDDTYHVGEVGDTVVEGTPQGGIDKVISSISFTLSANVENLDLLLASNGTGNSLANIINGSSLDNVIDGRGGIDTMSGGNGNDRYIVDNAGDQVLEFAGGGALDRVQTSTTYSLGAGSQVELLETTNQAGTAAIDLVGNELDNTITGNAGTNTLVGGLGKDILVGGGGADIFVWRSTDESSNATDRADIVGADFNALIGDKLAFNLIDADGNAANGDSEFDFIGSGPFTAAGQISTVTDGIDTFILLNTDGDAIQEATIRVLGVHVVDDGWFVF